jgi:hypothetical protein
VRAVLEGGTPPQTPGSEESTLVVIELRIAVREDVAKSYDVSSVRYLLRNGRCNPVETVHGFTADFQHSLYGRSGFLVRNELHCGSSARFIRQDCGVATSIRVPSLSCRALSRRGGDRRFMRSGSKYLPESAQYAPKTLRDVFALQRLTQHFPDTDRTRLFVKWNRAVAAHQYDRDVGP